MVMTYVSFLSFFFYVLDSHPQSVLTYCASITTESRFIIQLKFKFIFHTKLIKQIWNLQFLVENTAAPLEF